MNVRIDPATGERKVQLTKTEKGVLRRANQIRAQLRVELATGAEAVISTPAFEDWIDENTKD